MSIRVFIKIGSELPHDQAVKVWNMVEAILRHPAMQPCVMAFDYQRLILGSQDNETPLSDEDHRNIAQAMQEEEVSHGAAETQSDGPVNVGLVGEFETGGGNLEVVDQELKAEPKPPKVGNIVATFKPTVELTGVKFVPTEKPARKKRRGNMAERFACPAYPEPRTIQEIAADLDLKIASVQRGLTASCGYRLAGHTWHVVDDTAVVGDAKPRYAGSDAQPINPRRVGR